MTLLDEIRAGIDWANLVGPGHLPLGDVEWAQADAWAEDLDHPIWLTVTEPSRTLELSPQTKAFQNEFSLPDNLRCDSREAW